MGTALASAIDSDNAGTGGAREPSVSIVIPAYNEAGRLPGTIEALRAGLAPCGPLEIIVVDDGSTDETPAVLKGLLASRPELKVLRQPANAGKGATVRVGMLAARGQRVCFCDADLPLTSGTLRRLLERLESDDVVIASRAAPVRLSWRQRLRLRRVASALFHWIIRRQFGLTLPDTQCGVKGFRREAARAIFSRAVINGFAFDVEVLLLAEHLGYAVTQLPVEAVPSTRSSIRLLPHSLEVLRDLWRLRQRHARGPR